MMSKRFVVVAVLLVAPLFCARPAFAQNVPLSRLLADLIQARIVLAPPPEGFVSHEAHFLPGADQALAPYLFSQQLITHLATVPIGSSSGGFSFTFDPTLGTFQRESNSFGPAFAERALTNGRGKLTLGANYQYSKYDSFEGASLSEGDIRFYLRHLDVPGDNFFEFDLIEANLVLDLSSSTTTFFANYGVTDRWDLAVAVPIVRVSMQATVVANILRLATAGTTIHSFPGGGTTRGFSDEGSAAGIGDIQLRSKYRLTPPGRSSAFALGVDVRVPSGDAENLLGSDAAAVTATLIGSSSNGRVAPHFNVGYTLSSSGDVVEIPNEFGYRVGAEFVAAPTVTLAVDLLGRTLVDTDRLRLSVTDLIGLEIEEYVAQRGSLNLASLALGGKFNVSGNLLLNANVLVSLTSAGVTSRVTPVIGFDYSF